MNAMAIQIQSKKRFRVSDFLLTFGDDERRVESEAAKPWQHMKLIAQMFVAQSNAESKRKKRK